MLLKKISNKQSVETISTLFVSFLEKEGTDFTNSSLRVWYSGMNRRRMPFSYGSLNVPYPQKLKIYLSKVQIYLCPIKKTMMNGKLPMIARNNHENR